MQEWKSININIQNIKAETDKAVLILMPNLSEYNGYYFWHPSKLIREGRNSYSKSIVYTDNWNFRIIKYGKGKYNSREIIDEKHISAEEFEEVFKKIDQSIVSKKNINNYETHKPKEIEPLTVEILPELKDE